MDRPGKFAIAGGGNLLAAAAALLAIANPKPAAYERHAAEQLSTYLKTDTCSRVYQMAGGLPGFLVETGCRWAVDLGQPHLQAAIGRATERQNYGLFSIYRTQIGPQQTWPSYRRTTLAIANRFIPVREGWYSGDRPLADPTTPRLRSAQW